MVSESPRERAMYKGKTTVDFFTRIFCQGITEAKVEKVLEAINKEKSFSFVSGSQILRNRQRVKKVPFNIVIAVMPA